MDTLSSRLRYGLIGFPLGHSLSPFIHERLMEAAGIDGEYRLYEIPADSLPAQLPRILSTLDGFNCTIPFKQKVIPYLDGLASTARRYGAVNTVFQGIGHNTDGPALSVCLTGLDKRKVRILGAGGVARALAIEAAGKNPTAITVEARNLAQGKDLVAHVKKKGYHRIRLATPGGDFRGEILLNGTPVGMWPRVDGLPVAARIIRQSAGAFDAVYNPTATRLVLRAKSARLPAQGGMKMLFEQALAAQRLWHPQAVFDPGDLKNIYQELARETLRRHPFKLLLTGFMGSGKTSLGQQIAKSMKGDLPFIDLDDFIVRQAGEDISQIFKGRGESGFRSIERRCLVQLLQTPGPSVIATGGGALVQPGVEAEIKGSRALVVYLEVGLATALSRLGKDSARPLLSRGPGAVEALYERRKPLYEEVSDLTLPAESSLFTMKQAVRQAFDW